MNRMEDKINLAIEGGRSHLAAIFFAFCGRVLCGNYDVIEKVPTS